MVTAVTTLALGVLVAIWIIPKKQALRAAQRSEIPESSSRAGLENEFRRTLVGIFGGTAVIATFALSARQFQDTLQRQDDGLLTDRFDRALQHLASDDPVITIGGAYEMERIAREVPSMHWTVMEVLTNYVQMKSLEKVPEALSATRLEDGVLGADHGEATILFPLELQAVLTVIGRRTLGKNDCERGEREGDNRIHLTYSDLRGAWLIGLDFRDAIFVGSNLENANLTNARLEGAVLTAVKGLAPDQVKAAFIDDTTKPPEPEPIWWPEALKQSKARVQ